MRIAIYIDDAGIRDIDISRPDKGNPGVGGTPFCFAILAYYLKYFHPEINIGIFHRNNSVVWPKTDDSYVTDDVYSAAKLAKNLGYEAFIFRFGLEAEDFYHLLDELNLKGIGWQHNFATYTHMNYVSKHNYFKKCVFCGTASYQKFLDHPSIKKCYAISNPINIEEIPEYEPCYEKNVIWSGQISKLKGFHVLARNWPKILNKVPDAKLLIMGGGALYNRGAKLGSLGLAEETFENSFKKSIVDKDGKLHPSIKLLGVLGPEKTDTYGKCRVGVVNPTGTETLSLTALEMEASGLPIVSMNGGGVKYSVENKHTGLLFKNDDEFVENVCDLLTDNNLYLRLHSQTREFVKNNFAPINAIDKWVELLDCVINDREFKQKVRPIKCTNIHEKAVLLNSYLRTVFPFLPPLSKVSYSKVKNKNR